MKKNNKKTIWFTSAIAIFILVLIIVINGIYTKTKTGAQYSTDLNYLIGKCEGTEKIYDCGTFYCRDSLGTSCSDAYSDCVGATISYTCGGGGGGIQCTQDDDYCSGNILYYCNYDGNGFESIDCSTDGFVCGMTDLGYNCKEKVTTTYEFFCVCDDDKKGYTCYPEQGGSIKSYCPIICTGQEYHGIQDPVNTIDHIAVQESLCTDTTTTIKSSTTTIKSSTTTTIPKICSTDNDCNDNNQCTTDKCTSNNCVNTPIQGCGGCKSYQELKDGKCAFSFKNFLTKDGILEFYNDYTWQSIVGIILIVAIIGIIIYLLIPKKKNIF